MLCTTGLGHLASRGSPVSASDLPVGVCGLQMCAGVPGFLVLCVPGITPRSPGWCDELSHFLGHLSNPQEWTLPLVIIPDKFQSQTCSQSGLDFLAGFACLHLTLTSDTKVPKKNKFFLPRKMIYIPPPHWIAFSQYVCLDSLLLPLSSWAVQVWSVVSMSLTESLFLPGERCAWNQARVGRRTEGSKEERVRKGHARQIPNIREAGAHVKTGSWNPRKVILRVEGEGGLALFWSSLRESKPCLLLHWASCTGTG